MKTDITPIPLFKVFLAPEKDLMPRLRDVLYSGQISEGEPVYEFERRFSSFVGLSNVLSFYSGTAALHTALCSLASSQAMRLFRLQ
jgi:dTDP-4-amino-4,6-dideoxygalactose transaminase